MAEDLPPLVIDLYVHASPDLIERIDDDFGLATSLRDGGVTAAVHRNHFTSTAERARIVETATGYPLLGAVICSDAIGGLNPVAVEHALHMGAAWIGLPTLSAQHHRARTVDVPSSARVGVRFGPGQLRLTDDRGHLLPAVSEIVELASNADVPLNVGYSSFVECSQLLAAHGTRHRCFVVTNPLSTPGWSLDELRSVAGESLFVELTGFSLLVAGRHGMGAEWVAEAVDIIDAVGSDHVVLSSDSGMRGAPRSAELLANACRQLARGGVAESQLELMAGELPASLIGWPERRVPAH